MFVRTVVEGCEYAVLCWLNFRGDVFRHSHLGIYPVKKIFPGTLCIVHNDEKPLKTI